MKRLARLTLVLYQETLSRLRRIHRIESSSKKLGLVHQIYSQFKQKLNIIISLLQRSIAKLVIE